ncbi:bifunctional aminoglycoside phosphotransferase/ATP-binding protein [Kamptonema formosum]|nr:AAA family ATPase [Kamptonema formosum]
MLDASLPPLIQQMLRSDFYPHSVTEPIELLQTHISFVLLTGDFAYKLKKPVNFGFLDYSTLEKRHHFCTEELRMNQRGAPELYLEVLPIYHKGDNIFTLEPFSLPVEYVLKMQQFSQDFLFVNMFEQGRLNEKHLESLGRDLANFHASAQVSDYIRKFGEIPPIREVINNNYRLSEKYIGGPQTQKQYDETRQYTEVFFSERQKLFASRIQSNKIRECHGDLHLKNIALWHDKIMLFDCIEFNEPFRFVDVMYDVAFTVMDLEARGRKDLANAFLNTYIEQTGDWEGIQILRFYLIRQAYVRANVTAFLLDDPAVPIIEKNQAEETAAHYYQLAYDYTKSCQGQMILMSGLSGSGKSTVARYLARHFNAIHIRSDAVRKHLGGVPLYERGGDDLYSSEMNGKTYSRLLELGILLAKEGYTVILDAKYDRNNLRMDAINCAETNNISGKIIHCTAPIEVLRSRLQNRTGDIADATVDLLTSQQLAAEPFTEIEKRYLITIDTTQDLDLQIGNW